MGSLLCRLAETDPVSYPVLAKSLKFAVLCAGFTPRAADLSDLFSESRDKVKVAGG